MAWGASAAAGIDDLCRRLAAGDPKLASLVVLKHRRFLDADVAALCRALQGNTMLTELTCSSHPISMTAAAELGAMLRANSSIQHLSIGNSSWGDEALAALAQGLQHNSSVTHWDLESRGLTSGAAASLRQVLCAHRTLQHVVLSHNSRFGNAGLAALCAEQPQWAALSHLELADCGLTAQGVAALAAAAGSMRQLQELELSHNVLGSQAAAALQQLLQSASQLRRLKLRHTGLQDAGVAGLAQGLPAAASLAHLDLSSSGLGDAGLQALAAALARSNQCRLQSLLLGGNPRITDAGVVELAQALSSAAGRDTGLHLDLSGSGIGASGVTALAAVPGLTQLSLFNTKLGANEAAVAALQACIADGGFARLAGLNLSGCQLAFEQLQGLVTSLTGEQQQQQQQPVAQADPGGTTARCAALATLELGANPGSQAEGFEAMLAGLRAVRPSLDVHWRVVDQGDRDDPAGGGGGPGCAAEQQPGQQQ